MLGMENVVSDDGVVTTVDGDCGTDVANEDADVVMTGDDDTAGATRSADVAVLDDGAGDSGVGAGQGPGLVWKYPASPKQQYPSVLTKYSPSYP